MLSALVWSRTITVSPSGENSGAETLKSAAAQLGPGDTLFLQKGIYQEILEITRSGTADNPIVIAGEDRQGTILDGAFLLPEGDNSPLGKKGQKPGPAAYKALLSIKGNHVHVRNLTLRHSRGRGVVVQADHTRLSNLVSVSNWNAGITLTGTDNAVDASDIWENAQCNSPEAVAARSFDAVWPGNLMVVDSRDSAVRHCRVFRNYGEGIIDLRSTRTRIVANEIFDNWAVDLYLDCSVDSHSAGNLIYYTDQTRYWRGRTDRPPTGISINEEYYPRSANNRPGAGWKVVNNFVYNTGIAFNVWPGEFKEEGITVRFDRVRIAHNTFVSTRTGTVGDACVGMSMGDRPTLDSSIEQNLVYMKAGRPFRGPIPTELRFKGNVFSGVEPSGMPEPVAAGFIPDPYLSLGVGETPQHSWLRLGKESPLRGKGDLLPHVPDDFFGTPRRAPATAGAFEFP